MNRNLLVTFFFTAVLALLPARCFGDFLLIDDFDSGEGSVILGPEETGSVELDIFGIDPNRTVCGERQIFVDGQATEIDSLLDITLRDPLGGEPFFNDIFSFNSFGTLGYRWGQTTDLNLALDQLDLTIANAVDSMSGRFEINVSIALTSNRGSANEATESVTRDSIETEQTDFSLLWQANEFSIIDFSDIDVIELSFEGDSFQVNLDTFSVNAVPEPGSLALVAAIGFAGSMRRRR